MMITFKKLNQRSIMHTFIALLRGINVSGQKLIKMADLRISLEKAGFKGAKTYIQSGNIVLQTPEADPKVVELQIKTLIQKDFGFEVPTIVVTADYLQESIDQNPFPNEDLKKVYLVLLHETPTQDRIDILNQFPLNGEQFVLDGKRIYIFSPMGAGKSRLTNNLFESKLKVAATTRNWNTTNKLIAMAETEEK